MSLRVAFDLDGTLADMHATLRREAAQLFPETSGRAADAADEGRKTAAPSAGVRLTDRQQAALWEHVKRIEDFWYGLPETEPGIVARIAEAAMARHWEVLFLTTRPLVAGATVQRQSQRWLEAKGFPLPSVFVVYRSRGQIAAALDLDAVVDDRPENCVDVALDSKATAILVLGAARHATTAGAASAGAKIVDSVSAALALLLKLDASRRERRVVRSFKRLIGKDSGL